MKVEFANKYYTELRIFVPIEIDESLLDDPYLDDSWNELIEKSSFFGKYRIAKCVMVLDEFSVIAFVGNYETLYSKVDTILNTGDLVLCSPSHRLPWKGGDFFGTVTPQVIDYMKKKIEEELEWLQDHHNYKCFMEDLDLGPEITIEEIDRAFESGIEKAIMLQTIKPQPVPNQQLTAQERWEKEGVYKFFNGKKLTDPYTGIVMEIDIMWKDLFERHEFPSNLPRCRSEALTVLQDKKYEGDITIASSTTTYKAHIESRKSTVERTKVRKARVFPLLRRLSQGAIEKKHVKLYGNLSNVKMDLAMTDFIEVWHPCGETIKIPISFEFVDEDTVTGKFLGKTKTMPYDCVVNPLVGGRTIRSRTWNSDFYEIASLFDLDKAQALSRLKDALMLQQL